MTTAKLKSPVEEAILSPKEEVLELVRDLPDNATFEEIQYYIHMLEQVVRSEADSREGRVLSQAEARALLNRWTGV